MKDPLKLVALDRDDLDIVSTHLQDAVLKVCDVIWHPAEQRVVLALSRFDWGCTCDGSPDLRRCRTALRFERVSCFKARNVRPTDKGAVLNLLAIEFAENDPPGGIVTLTFSGGAAMRLEVECLECELADLGPAWNVRTRPEHPDQLDEPAPSAGGRALS
jgi:hypothetical protein